MLTNKMRKVYDKFGIPSPTNYLSKIWYICKRGEQSSPIEMDLENVGKIEVIGWVAPVNPYTGIKPGIDIYVNKRLFLKGDEKCIPPNAMELIGVIGIIGIRDSDVTEEFLPSLEKRIASYLEPVFDNWLKTEVTQEEYQQIIQPMIESNSERLFNLIIRKENPLYLDITRKYHSIKSNEGRISISELIRAETDLPVLATTALSMENSFVKLNFGSGLLLDLRRAFDRLLVILHLRENWDGIEFVDTGDSSLIRENVKVQEVLSPSHERLKQWFEKGFRNSQVHRKVTVKITDANALNGFPAILISNRDPSLTPSDNETCELFDCSWIWTSILLIDPGSPVCVSILNLPEDSIAWKYLPVSIHHLASLSALGTLPQIFEMGLWLHMREQVEQFGSFEKQIKNHEKRIYETQGAHTENEHLRQQLQELEKKFDELKEELSVYRALFEGLELFTPTETS